MAAEHCHDSFDSAAYDAFDALQHRYDSLSYDAPAGPGGVEARECSLLEAQFTRSVT